MVPRRGLGDKLDKLEASTVVHRDDSPSVPVESTRESREPSAALNEEEQQELQDLAIREAELSKRYQLLEARRRVRMMEERVRQNELNLAEDTPASRSRTEQSTSTPATSSSGKRPNSVELVATHAKRSAPTPRPRAPEVYSGQSYQAMLTFIQTIEDSFEVIPDAFPTDKEKVAYARNYTTGSPREAWKRRCNIRGKDASWEEYCQFLKDQHQTPLNRGRHQYYKYIRSAQRNDQTVFEYATYLERLQEDFEPIPDSQKRDHFISSLRADLRQALIDRITQQDTYEEVVQMAMTLEDNGRKPQRRGPEPPRPSSASRDKLPYRGPNPPKKDSQPRPFTPHQRGGPATSPNTTEKEKRPQSTECFNCGKKGHWARECRSRPKGEKPAVSKNYQSQ